MGILINGIYEYAPILTDEAISKYGGGFTVLAHNEHQALKIALEEVSIDEIERIDLLGEWDLDDHETQERLEMQNN